MVPRKCPLGGSPLPRTAPKSGSSDKATLILKDALEKSMFLTPARNSAGSSRSSRSCRNVTWASTFETTLRAWNSVPSSSATPFARPRRVLPELQEPPPEPGELRQVPGPERPGVGRGLEQRGLDEIRHALEHRLVARQRLGIAGGELRDLLPGQLLVGSHEQEATVGKR